MLRGCLSVEESAEAEHMILFLGVFRGLGFSKNLLLDGGVGFEGGVEDFGFRCGLVGLRLWLVWDCGFKETVGVEDPWLVWGGEVGVGVAGLVWDCGV